MKEKLIITSKISNLVLAWFNFFMFFSMKCCWSGISKTLGYEKSNSPLIYWLPIIVWVLLMAIFIANICLYKLMKKESKIWSFICNGVNIIFLIVNLVIIKLGAIDYLDYVWPSFFTYFSLTLVVLLVIFMLFIYPKTFLVNNKLFKYAILTFTVIFIGFNIFNVSFNRLTTGPVVYAVEDEYQIVFSSSVESRAWVTIDGERYFDDYNGSNRSNEKIHKVIIPMEVLNEAKEYEVHVQKFTYRGPFGGYKGRDISEKYSFKPVDTSDGLDYYNLSDIHMASKASYEAQKHYDYELLVLAGDIVSMMDTFADANLVNEIAHEMTNGEIAVVYARGNHELKGKYAEEFHKFVGADDERFYYSFKLDGVYGLVLDIGEDHDDDWWEYYDTADYEQYRNKQYLMLEKEIKSGEFKNYDYQLVVCHIPPVFVNSRKNHVECKTRFTELLNQMEIDMCISGHQHDLMIFEPGLVKPNETLNYNPDFSSKKTYKGYLTDFNFNCILVSKRGKTQTDSSSLTNMKEQIGVLIRVDFTKNNQTITYNTSNGELVNVVNPFAIKDYGNTIVFPLN
jgi:predicted phosphodiesterase